jgi:hypothetical protein
MLRGGNSVIILHFDFQDFLLPSLCTRICRVIKLLINGLANSAHEINYFSGGEGAIPGSGVYIVGWKGLGRKRPLPNRCTIPKFE